MASDSEVNYVEAARAAVRLAEIPILRGNEVELLIDGGPPHVADSVAGGPYPGARQAW